MKKAISILLSVVITLSAMVGAFMVPAAALADETYFETVSNWKIYASGKKIGEDGSVASSVNIFQNTTTDFVTHGDKSIRMSGNARVAAIKLEGIEKGKKYILSFKYYAPTGTTLASSGYMRTPGIYADGTEVGNNGVLSNPVVSGATTPNSLALATWHNYSIEFSCTDTTNLYFAFQFWFGGSSNDTRNLYFDNFKLEEVEVPTVYDDPSNWFSPKLADALGQTATGTATATKDTTVAKTGSSSVKMSGMHGNMAAIKLVGIEEGKTYKFTLWYKAAFASGYTKYTLQAPGLYKGGSELTTNQWGHFYIADSVAALGNQEKTNSDEWYKVEFEFKAPKEDVYFTTRSWLGATVWFDDVKVEEVEVPTVYDDPENWSVYAKDDILGETSSVTGATVAKDTTASKSGSSSVKITGINANIAAVKLEGIQAGKTYKVSLWYKGAFGSGNSKYVVQAPGIYTKGSKLETNSWNWLTVANAVVALANVDRTSETEWYSFEATFVAPSNDLYFAARTWVCGGLWFDDVKVEEQETLTYFDNPENWKLSTAGSYMGNTEDTNVGSSGYSISVNSDAAFINSGKSSLKVYANGYGATVKMDGVEAGKSYAFSFKFLMPEQTNISSIGKAFWYSGIYASGTKYNTTGTRGVPDNSAAIAVGNDPIKANVVKGQWQDFRIEFGVPENNTDIWFNMSYWWASGFTLYYDDFKLEELSYEVKPLLYHDYDNPPTVTEITFDDGRPYSFQVPQTMKIAPGPERDGKQTNALHIIKGEYSSAACLNWNTIVGKDADPSFTIPVKENTLYNFSCWLYLEEDGRVIYGDIYPSYNSHDRLIGKVANILSKNSGQWVKYEASFQTTAGQTKASFYFNFAMEVASDLWIDDVRYEEQLPGILDDANGATYCEDPFNVIPDETIKKIESAKTGVYEIDVKFSSLYTFGITASGSNKTSVFLSVDGKNPMEVQNNKGVGATISPTGKAKRYGYSFVTDNSGKIYLVVNNPDGSLKLNTPQVFFNTVSNTGTALGRTNNPNEDKMVYNVIDLVVDGGKNTVDSDGSATDSELTSPQTGESNLALAVMIIAAVSTLVAVLAITKRKELVVKNEQ